MKKSNSVSGLTTQWSNRLLAVVLTALCAVCGFAASPTGTLPLVYMTTASGQPITDKENYVPGTVYIDPLTTGLDSLGSAAAPIAAQLKGRGNWTWNGFDKRPYRIKFDKKQSVFGLPKNKHWVLLALADDYLGCLKTPAGFRISEAVGMRWTPAIQPVELVLNGQYQGLYFLVEHVRVDANRINITEQADLQTHPDSITGGWLVEIDNYWSENNIELDEGNGQHVMISLDSPEILSEPQRNYIVSQMNAINAALYASPTTNDYLLTTLIDIQEAARFYLVQEIMEDCESYHGSCKLYKDMDQNGIADRWKFGPVWDFGNAYDRHQEEWIYVNPTWPQYWIGQLATWPVFQQAVQEQWWIFYHEQKDSVRADIRAFADRIEAAARRDAEVWRGTQNYCDNSNYADVRDRFFRRYDWRIQWLYSQWGEGIQPNPQAIEQTPFPSGEGRGEATKLLRNGRIFILRDGHTYDLLGVPVQ